jgi:hypothetical protein
MLAIRLNKTAHPRVRLIIRPPPKNCDRNNFAGVYHHPSPQKSVFFVPFVADFFGI